MKVLNTQDARVAMMQFIMEVESNDLGHWEDNSTVFCIDGPQGQAWFSGIDGSHMNLFVASYIYEWVGGLEIASVTIQHGAINSVDINFAIESDDDINEFSVRLPCKTETTNQLEKIQTVQFAQAPTKLETWEINVSIDRAVPVKQSFNHQD